MHHESIFCSPDPKADPRWGWYNVANPRKNRRYCPPEKRARRNQFKAQRIGYSIPYYLVALDLAESRLGAHLEENRRAQVMAKFTRDFFRVMDEMDALQALGVPYDDMELVVEVMKMT